MCATMTVQPQTVPELNHFAEESNARCDDEAGQIHCNHRGKSLTGCRSGFERAQRKSSVQHCYVLPLAAKSHQEPRNPENLTRYN